MTLIDGRLCKHCNQPFAHHRVNNSCPSQTDPQQQTKFEAVILNYDIEKIIIDRLLCGNCKQAKPVKDEKLSEFFNPIEYYYCPVCGVLYREI